MLLLWLTLHYGWQTLSRASGRRSKSAFFGHEQNYFQTFGQFLYEKSPFLRFLVVLKSENLHMCSKIRVLGKFFFEKRVMKTPSLDADHLTSKYCLTHIFFEYVISFRLVTLSKIINYLNLLYLLSNFEGVMTEDVESIFVM